MRRWRADFCHRAASQLGHIAHGDGMHRADVIVYCAALGDGELTMTEFQMFEVRSDSGKVRCFPADQAGEKPFAAGLTGESLPKL